MAWVKDFISSGGGGGKVKIVAACAILLAMLIYSRLSVKREAEVAHPVQAAPPVAVKPLPQNVLIKPQPLPQNELIQPQAVPLNQYAMMAPPVAPPAPEPEQDESPLGISYRQPTTEPGREQAPETAPVTSPLPPVAQAMQPPPLPLPGQEKEKHEVVTISDGQGHSSTLGTTYLLPRGSIVECILQTRLDGSFAGPLKAQVSEDVYAHDGLRIILPAGAEALGDARAVQSTDQERLSVDFDELGYWKNNRYVEIKLDNAVGLDQQGATALKDKVNHHLVPMLAAATVSGLLGGLALSGTGSALTAGGWDMYRQGVAQQIGLTGNIMLERFMNMRPTITIREGTRIKLYVPEDVNLPDAEEVK